jgi:hypothetical protein
LKKHGTSISGTGPTGQQGAFIGCIVPANIGDRNRSEDDYRAIVLVFGRLKANLNLAFRNTNEVSTHFVSLKEDCGYKANIEIHPQKDRSGPGWIRIPSPEWGPRERKWARLDSNTIP